MEELIREERKNLEGLNIHVLRAIGKKTGVKSPASLSKGDLISQILEIRFGKKNAAATETRGRPMKNVNLYGVYDVFSNFGDISNSFAAGYSKPYKYDTKSFVSKYGIVEILSGGYGVALTSGFLHDSTNVYIPSSIISTYGLKDGDTIEFTVGNVDKANVVTHISTINGISADLVKNRVEFKNLKQSYPTSKFELGEEPGMVLLSLISPIGKGSCGIITGGPKSGKSSLIRNIAYSIKRNNSEAFVSPILISKSNKEIEVFSEEKLFATVYTSMNLSNEDTIRSLTIGINRGLRQVELGKDVVIVIDDLNMCYKAYFELLKKHNRNTLEAIEWIKSIFELCGKLSNGASLTILSVVDDSTEEGRYLKQELNQFVNFNIVFDNTLSKLRLFPGISIDETLSNLVEKVLSSKERILSNSVRENYLIGCSGKQKVDYYKSLITAKNFDEIK